MAVLTAGVDAMLLMVNHYELFYYKNIPYMAKHSRGETYAVRIENECSWETFMIEAPFHNECLLSVNYLT